MDKFVNQLTDTVKTRSAVEFAIKQLEKYGDVEGTDFVVKETNNGVAVFTTGSRIEKR